MKPAKKAQKRLNRRISSWAETIRTLPRDTNPQAYRKPGSMKK